jgi:GTP1/Obg family GTP-binding protein
MNSFAALIVCVGSLLLAIGTKPPLADAQEAVRERRVQLGESVSEEKLKAFARAYVVLQQIRLEYEPTIQTVRDPNEVTRIRQETNSRIEQVLQKQGLDVESYAKIFTAVSSDEKLKQRTIELIQIIPR